MSEADGMPSYDAGLVEQINYINKTQNAHGIYGGVSATGGASTPLNYNAPLIDPMKLPDGHPQKPENDGNKYNANYTGNPNTGGPGSASVPNSSIISGSSNLPFNPYGINPNTINTGMNNSPVMNNAIPLAASSQTLWTPGVNPGMDFSNMGPDMLGSVAGSRARLDDNLKLDANRRDNITSQIAMADLGIRQADLDMRQRTSDQQKYTFDRSVAIQQGMAQAAQEGGYTGAIEYLKQVDPEKAIQFHMQKLDLDQKMMSTDTMRAQQPNEQAKAMVEGYGLLGKVGMGILNAPENLRQAMWDRSRPMAEIVLGKGNAPIDVNDAAGILLLGASQATDANTLAQLNSGIGKGQSNLVGLINQRNAVINKYGAGSEQVQALNLEIQGEQAKLSKNQSDLVDQQLKQQQAKQQSASSIFDNTNKIQKNIDDNAKEFNDTMDQYTNVAGLLQILKNDPTNSLALNKLANQYIMMGQSNKIQPVDFERTAQGDAGFGIYLKKAQEWMDGKIHNIDPDELRDMTAAMAGMMQRKYQQQKGWETDYSKKMQNNNGVANLDQLTYPSASYERLMSTQQYPDIIKRYGLEELPTEMQTKVAEAISQAKNPQQVQYAVQKAQQMIQQAQQQTRMQMGQGQRNLGQQ